MSKQNLLINIYNAYYQARKNKRNTKEQLAFEVDHENQLHQLFEKICAGTYTVSPSKAFVIEKPVYREIFAPQFIDRVVHHLIAQYIQPQIELQLIDDAYSCRKGKGTSYGINRAKYFMRSVTANYAKDAYILKLDIAGYFMNMNRELLYEQIKKMKLVESIIGSNFEKNCVEYLLKEVIFSNPTENCTINGDSSLWKFVPNNKSLFHSPKNCGLPIGNLTSQLFGNIYLNEFDHWVKNDLGIKHYGRYVDDMVFMHTDQIVLKQSIEIITRKLQSYDLQVHPKKIYLQHYTKGVPFLGQYIKPYRSYISNRTKNNVYILIDEIAHIFKNTAEMNFDLLVNIRSRINSYWGIFLQANSYNILKKLMNDLPTSFYQYFYFEKYKTTWKCKLKRSYKLNPNNAILQPARI